MGFLSVRSIVVLFGFGAVCMTLGDLCHVASGALSYPPNVYGTYVAGQPFWVPAFFGACAVAAGVGHTALRAVSRGRFGTPRGPAASWPALAPLVATGLYCASGFLGPAGGTSDVVLAAAAVAVWYAFDRTGLGLAFDAGLALVGCVVEVVLITNGIFHYEPHQQNVAGLFPSWLPWLYVTAGSTLTAVAPVLAGWDGAAAAGGAEP